MELEYAKWLLTDMLNNPEHPVDPVQAGNQLCSRVASIRQCGSMSRARRERPLFGSNARLRKQRDQLKKALSSLRAPLVELVEKAKEGHHESQAERLGVCQIERC